MESKCDACGTTLQFGEGRSVSRGLICDDCDPEDINDGGVVLPEGDI